MNWASYIVDGHVHFFDRRQNANGLHWAWAEALEDHPVMGDIGAVRAQRFLPGSLRAEAHRSGVVGCVHVQAAIGTEDPELETAWLHSLVDVPDAVIGDLRLNDPDAMNVIARHERYPHFRGIRDMRPIALDDAVVRDNVRRLAERGLVVELPVNWRSFGAVRALAESAGNATLVVEHIGLPTGLDVGEFSEWRKALTMLSPVPQVVLKLSGWGMADPAWVAPDLRPWLEAAIQALGAPRCMFGSNWPLDRAASSYADIVTAVGAGIRDASPEDREAIAHGTAETVYRLNISERPAVGIDNP